MNDETAAQQTPDPALVSRMHRRYEQLSDEELASIAARREQLTDEARIALDGVIGQRDAAQITQWAQGIRDEQATPAPADEAPPPEPVAWAQRPGTHTSYAKGIHLARWLAFIPAMIWAMQIHPLIVRWAGFTDLATYRDGDISAPLAFAAAGIVTAFVAIAIGLWVCPARNKRVLALVVGGIYIADGITRLVMIGRLPELPQLQRLVALDSILGMATCITLVGGMWIAPRKPAASASLPTP